MPTTTTARPRRLKKAELDSGEFDYERWQASLPRSFDDFAARRKLVLHRNACPIAPLDAAGMPPPGADFVRLAGDLCASAYHRDTGVDAPTAPVVKGLRGEAKAEALRVGTAAFTAYLDDYFNPALEYAYVRALYEERFTMPVAVKQRFETAEYVSGNIPGDGKAIPGCYGPPHWKSIGDRPRVMVLGKAPGREETRQSANFVGRSSEALHLAFRECGLGAEVDPDGWYYSSVVKHASPDPASDSLTKGWLKNCLPLLYCELYVFRPRFVLCLGGDAVSVIEPGSNVTKMYGRIVDKAVKLHRPGKPAKTFTYRAMAAIHPSYTLRQPQMQADLVNSVGTFAALVRGERTEDVEKDIEHTCLYTERQLADAVDEVIADSERGVHQPIAVDGEWHGARPGESGAYLRTVQFAHRPKRAFCVVLHSQGGKPAFRPGIEAARKHLTRLLKDDKSKGGRKVRLGGHFLRADMPWLIGALGIDATAEFAAAKTWQETRTKGGWDTGSMCHAYQEVMEGGYKLENLAARFCGVPRYDIRLQEWKKRFCAERGLTDKQLDGYGQCPDDVLHPYALYDADATIRLFYKFNGDGDRPGLLDLPMTVPEHDARGQESGRTSVLAGGHPAPTSREAAWVSHKATLAALEMEMTGLEVDRVRGDDLTMLFMDAKVERIDELRQLVRWEDRTVDAGLTAKGKPKKPKLVQGFNVDSSQQVSELLFGEQLNGKSDPTIGEITRLRPPGALSLGLTPIKVAGTKVKKTWEVAMAEGLLGKVNPSTDKESLGILSYDDTPIAGFLDASGKPLTRGDVVGKVRDIRFVGQVCKGTLRTPFQMADEFVLDEDGDFTYDGGLLHWIGEDARVRTHFGLVETGRWSSWLPNLQNISKRRESDYERILGSQDPTSKYYKPGGKYLYPIRSMIVASEGCVLIEADYKMAEMAGIGMLARDMTMLDMVRRNSLPESHPDFVDLHSLTAIEAFKLDTPANRALLESYNKKTGKNVTWGANKDTLAAIGCSSLRVAAKNVNFGVPYQRSAEAIARQCREEGADVTVADAQKLIDAYYARYPQIAAFLDACMARVLDPGWMCGTFGRLRRFTAADERSVLAEQQRQACNFPIQNLVADCISLACSRLYDYSRRLAREHSERGFRMCLQIHDALLFEVRYADVAWFLDEVLGKCMRDDVDIWPRDLDGIPLAGITQPYHLDIDSSVERYWGQKIDREWGLAMGLPEETPGGQRILPKAKKKAA